MRKQFASPMLRGFARPFSLCAGGFALPPGAEIATPALWPNGSYGIVTSDAGLTDFGPASGVRIQLGDTHSGPYRRAYRHPDLDLLPGVDYQCAIWYFPGSSGFINVEAYGNGGANRFNIRGPVANPTLLSATGFTVSGVDVAPIENGAYRLSFQAMLDAGAAGAVQVGIGPYASAAFDDVILLAAKVAVVA